MGFCTLWHTLRETRLAPFLYVLCWGVEMAWAASTLFGVRSGLDAASLSANGRAEMGRGIATYLARVAGDAGRLCWRSGRGMPDMTLIPP